MVEYGITISVFVFDNTVKYKNTVSFFKTMWPKLIAFVKVVELNGFAKAARELGMSKATMTRYIHELEREYGTTLLIRSTRHVSPTQAGQQFYQYALEVLQAERTLQATLTQAQTDIVGHIKVGLPASIMSSVAQHIIPRLRQAYPQLTLELIQGNHVQDLISSRFDMVIHCGSLPDVSFHATEIAKWRKVICAAPDYFEQQGKPHQLTDLSRHVCLDHADNHTHSWILQCDGQIETVPIYSAIQMNSSQALLAAAVAGVGLVFLPSFTVQQAVAEQRLVVVLADYAPPPLSMYALSSQRVSHSPKVALLINALQQLYQTEEMA